MTKLPDQRVRARIACVTAGETHDQALTELCAKAGYRLDAGANADRADLAVVDLRGVQITSRRASSIADAIRRKSADATLLFVVDPKAETREFATLRRFGEVAPADEGLDHVGRRMRETLRLRNIAEEAGERLKSLAAINRTVDFPVIATDASPPRVLIVGAPGPAAIDAINAIGSVADLCACVLTAGQAMRALDHQQFDLAVFLPTNNDAAIPALTRALRRHPKLGRTALLHIGETADDLAAAARKGGGGEFVLRTHVADTLGPRATLIARRARLAHAMRGFLRAWSGEGVRDGASGVFTPTFLGQHGARIAARADQTGRPLSVILTRLIDDSKGRRENDRRALRQGARLLGRITRAEDMVSRIAPGIFAIICPATTPTDANHIALRIDGVLSNTAFRRNDAGAPLSLKIDVAVAAHKFGAAISETISAGLRKLPETDNTTQPQRRSPQEYWRRVSPL